MSSHAPPEEDHEITRDTTLIVPDPLADVANALGTAIKVILLSQERKGGVEEGSLNPHPRRRQESTSTFKRVEFTSLPSDAETSH